MLLIQWSWLRRNRRFSKHLKNSFKCRTKSIRTLQLTENKLLQQFCHFVIFSDDVERHQDSDGWDYQRINESEKQDPIKGCHCIWYDHNCWSCNQNFERNRKSVSHISLNIHMWVWKKLFLFVNRISACDALTLKVNASNFEVTYFITNLNQYCLINITKT